jgi:hypothetical protein
MNLSTDPSIGELFPTPFEALAALSVSSRAEICLDFRQQLNTCLAGRTSA